MLYCWSATTGSRIVYAQKSLESLQVILKLSQNCPIDIPSCLKIVPKLSQGCLKIVSELSLNVSKFPRSFLKAVLKLFQSCPKVADIWAWRMGSMWDGIEI